MLGLGCVGEGIGIGMEVGGKRTYVHISCSEIHWNTIFALPDMRAD